ncbi:MAG TPA: NAD-dependent malic enzyme [Methylomirabilota bacterium]|nr:NAD-dependent malic enzyme [Methylomirabilota bacterium]
MAISYASPAITRLASNLRGQTLLETPALNKGTAFTLAERQALGLDGLLPPAVETIEEQSFRAYKAYQRKPDDLERHIYLRQLQDTNEVLFYRLLLDHIQEMLPIVYTPVVAEACQEFSHIYRRARGLIISYPMRDHIQTLLQNRPNKEVRVIVVTDGERILGIGDQGVGGLGIPIGKLSLYTLIGGVPPAQTLPIILDVGTNNAERLADPEYLGWRHERITGDEYYEFVDRFVQAVKKELPDTLLQWEDFSKGHARVILDRYRDQLITFNDDIQGTASVTAGAIFAGVRASGKRMRDQHVVMLGAGSAGIGVADALREALIADGVSPAEAQSRFWIVNSGGLLHSDRTDLSEEQRAYVQPAERVEDFPRTLENHRIGLSDVMHKVNATILIGLSTLPGAFTEAIVKEMARKCERPIILPLSNPTSKSEAIPEHLLQWTDGRALIATGSPFADVSYKGQKRRIAQCNNVFVFPAMGLALCGAGARRVTDSMFLAAAHALAEQSPARTDPTASLLPALTGIRRAAIEIAFAAAQQAQREDLCPKTSPDALREAIVAVQWAPVYPSYA